MASSKFFSIYNLTTEMNTEQDVMEIVRLLNLEQQPDSVTIERLDHDSTLTLSLILNQPVELMSESVMLRGRQLLVMPALQIASGSTVALSNEWMDHLTDCSLEEIISRDVHIVRANEVVTLEGKQEALKQAINTIEHFVLGRMISADSQQMDKMEQCHCRKLANEAVTDSESDVTGQCTGASGSVHPMAESFVTRDLVYHRSGTTSFECSTLHDLDGLCDALDKLTLDDTNGGQSPVSNNTVDTEPGLHHNIEPKLSAVLPETACVQEGDLDQVIEGIDEVRCHTRTSDDLASGNHYDIAQLDVSASCSQSGPARTGNADGDVVPETGAAESGHITNLAEPTSHHVDVTSRALTDVQSQNSELTGTSEVSGVVHPSTDEVQVFTMDDTLWEFIQFTDTTGQWKDRFKVVRLNDSNKPKVELSGRHEDIDQLKTYLDKNHFERSVIAETVPASKGRLGGAFVDDIQGIVRRNALQVLVRLSADGGSCQLIGMKSDVDRLRDLIAEESPETKAAQNTAVLDHLQSSVTSSASSTESVVEAERSSFATELSLRTDAVLKLSLSKSQITIVVLTGDILKQDCEVIVSPSNGTLDHGGGLSKVIADAAGSDLRRDCERFIMSSSAHRLAVSQVIDTRSGRIPRPVRRIIHACGPNGRDIRDDNTRFRLLHRTFYNCLDRAHQLKVKSIGLPAISSGVFAIPIGVVATAACHALIDFDTFLANQPASRRYLEVIKFVNIVADITRSMVDVFKELLLQPVPSQTAQDIADVPPVTLPLATNSLPSRNVSQSSGSADPHFSRLKKVAEQNGLQIVDVPNDGNSALNAIVDQLRRQGITNFDANLLRKQAVRHAKANIRFWHHPFRKDKYFSEMEMSGTRCDADMFRAIAAVVRKDIHILNEGGEFLVVSSDTDCPEPVTIGLTESEHYVSLCSAVTVSENRQAVTTKPNDVEQKSTQEHNAPIKDPSSSAVRDLGADEVALMDYSKLQLEAEQRGLTLVDVSRHKDCALYAIVDQLIAQGNNTFDVDSLRERIGANVQEDVEQFEMEGSKCRQDGDEDGTQSHHCRPIGESMWKTAAEILQKDIHVLDESGHVTKIEVCDTSPDRPLILGLVSRVHYVSLRSKDDTGHETSSETQKQDADTAQASESDVCPICMDTINNPKKLECGHIFCTECIDTSLTYQKKCPCCGQIFGELKGNQPEGGTMRVSLLRMDLEGYPGCGCIVIEYEIPSGIQKSNHPKPGQPYRGARRTAYLPNNVEGREICALLRRAFDAGLIFTIGRSTTTGQDNVVTWNDIHHKTNFFGPFGYPDPTYLSRVREELAANGILTSGQSSTDCMSEICSSSSPSAEARLFLSAVNGRARPWSDVAGVSSSMGGLSLGRRRHDAMTHLMPGSGAGGSTLSSTVSGPASLPGSWFSGLSRQFMTFLTPSDYSDDMEFLHHL